MESYNIGDRVVTKDYADLPIKLKNRTIGEVCGKQGTIVDKLYSEAYDCFIYKIQIDGYATVSNVSWTADALELIPETIEPSWNYDIYKAENLVIAILYDENHEEIARGHGHIIHEGILGIAQAASYACKKIYEKIGGKI